MTDEPGEDDVALLLRVEGGDEQALTVFFLRHRERLRRMIRLRLDRRLQGRIDLSDILQDAYVEVSRRAPEYLAEPVMPPFLWIRFLTVQTLVALHRRHLRAQMRDAAQEVSLHHGDAPEADSGSLAEMLLGRLTSPSDAARRAEMQLRLQGILNDMEPLDREVIALRHFEELSNREVAAVLGLSKSAASNRYSRALRRLKELVEGLPGFLDY